MKKWLVLFSLLGLYHYATAQQTFNAGLMAGLSLTQVHGDGWSGFDKAGLCVGGFVNTNVREKMNIQMELLYIEKGSQKNADPQNGDYNSYLLELNYLEVPILLRYHLKKIDLEAGPGFGALIKQAESDQHGPIIGVEEFKTLDVSFIFGVSYVFSDHVNVNWRINNSVLSISDRGEAGREFWYNTGVHNIATVVSLRYQF